MSKTTMEKAKKERLKVEYERFSVQYNGEEDVFSVTYLNDYEALIQGSLVRAIASESEKREELIAMILGTTKMVRNMTSPIKDKVEDRLIIASICELLESGISTLEIVIQFFYNFSWIRIEEVLKASSNGPGKAVEAFQKYKK